MWSFGDGGGKGSTVTHVFRAPGVYAVTVSATDALGNTTTSSPVTIKVVAKAAKVVKKIAKKVVKKKVAKKKVAKASIKPPSVVRLRTLRRRSWRLEAMVKLNAGANVTVRLRAGSTTIARTTRNVPDGSTPISLTLPKRYRKRGTFTLSVQVAGAKTVSTATFTLR